MRFLAFVGVVVIIAGALWLIAEANEYFWWRRHGVGYRKYLKRLNRSFPRGTSGIAVNYSPDLKVIKIEETGEYLTLRFVDLDKAYELVATQIDLENEPLEMR
jgi:hypothetical protein